MLGFVLHHNIMYIGLSYSYAAIEKYSKLSPIPSAMSIEFDAEKIPCDNRSPSHTIFMMRMPSNSHWDQNGQNDSTQRLHACII